MTTAFAVYSADDNSLRFYKRDTVPSVDDTFEGLKVTATYTDFDISTYSSSEPPLWYLDMSSFQLKTIIVEDENIKPVSTAWWFDGCGSVTIADLNKLDTSKVTDMSDMFNGCGNLTSLDISSWDTSKVTDMSGMFNGCSSLATVYVGDKWSIAAIVNSDIMFTDCTSIKGQSGTTYNSSEVNAAMANWDTGYLTYNDYMVFGVFSEDDSSLLWYRRRVSECQTLGDGIYEGRTCSTLLECVLDENKRATDFPLFYSAANKFIVVDNIPVANLVLNDYVGRVKKLDVRHLDVSACTSFDNIFSYLRYNTDTGNTESITWLDLSTWDTSSATSMKSMFEGSSDIKRIYVGDKWSVANVISSSDMFIDCINLVGGSGIVYDETKVDMTMANWDTGYLSKTKHYLVQNPSLTALGDAIRDKAGTTDKMTLDEMATAVEGISTGLDPSVFPEGVNNVYYTAGESVPAGSSSSSSTKPGCGSINIVAAIVPYATSIGDYAFYSCCKLTTIELPNATSIGYEAFTNCTALKTLVIRQSDRVCSLGWFVFINTALTSIYVPDSLVDSYKSATNWKSYASKIKPLSEYEGQA